MLVEGNGFSKRWPAYIGSKRVHSGIVHTGKVTVRELWCPQAKKGRKRAAIKADALQRIAEAEKEGIADEKWFDRLRDETLRRLGHEPAPVPSVREYFEQWLKNTQATVETGTFKDDYRGASELSINIYRPGIKLFGGSWFHFWNVTN